MFRTAIRCWPPWNCGKSTSPMPNSTDRKPPSFEDFRSTMEQLERLCGDFTGRAAEIIKEMRDVPKIRSDLNRFPMFALVFSAALALLAGILIGRYAR